MSSSTFGRQHRLCAGADYRSVFKSRQRWADGFFLIVVTRNGGLPARLGLAVSKRHIKRANQRNRIKRLVRESFRRVKLALSGLDVVVLTKGSPMLATNSEITERLQQQWQRIEQWRQK